MSSKLALGEEKRDEAQRAVGCSGRVSGESSRVTQTLCERPVWPVPATPSGRGVSHRHGQVWFRLDSASALSKKMHGHCRHPFPPFSGEGCPLPSHLSISAESQFHLSTGGSEGLNPQEHELHTRESLLTGFHTRTPNKVSTRSGSPTEGRPRMVTGAGSPPGRAGAGHCPVPTSHTHPPKPSDPSWSRAPFPPAPGTAEAGGRRASPNARHCRRRHAALLYPSPRPGKWILLFY